MLNTGSPSHDQRSSKLRRRSVAPLALAAAALCVAPPARAALLDEPPKLYTFKLDDPSATRLSLLESFHEANVERSAATFGVYAKGSWSGWRQSPWWSLAWQPSFVTSTAPAEYDAPPREAASLADDSASARGEDTLGAAGVFELPKVELPWLDRTRAGGAGLFTSTGTSFASNGFDALWAPAPKPLPW